MIGKNKLKPPKANLFIIFFLVLTACVGSVEYARSEDIQSGEEPGSQASRFEEESKRREKELQEKKIRKPQIEIPKEKEKPALPEVVKFILKDIFVTGATVFKPEKFRSIYESYLGREVNFRDLEFVANEIKGLYLKEGFVTTIVYIPQQDISAGRVEIKIVEGKIGEVKIEGNKWFSSSLLSRYFHSKEKEILDSSKIQKDLLRLDKNPDLEVRAVIEKGKEPGTTDIILKVEDKFPYHVGATVDNQGSRTVGKVRGSVIFRSTNLSGIFDTLYISQLKSKSSYGSFTSYSLPLDTYGTKLIFDYTYFYTNLKKEYKTSHIKGKSQICALHLLKELSLSDYSELGADVGVEIKSIHKRTAGSMTTNDQLRMPYIGFNLVKIDSFLGMGQTVFSPKFSFNIKDAFGSSEYNHPSASRSNTCGFFYKYEQALQRYQRMPWESRLLLSSDAQLTSSTLPSSEQFQLGGANSIRGYPEGDYLADIGISFSAEWVFPNYLLPKNYKLPHTKIPLRNQLEPVLFMDLGGGKILDEIATEDDHKFLMGIGAGLRFRFNDYISVKLDWAKHVGDDPEVGQGESTFHMSFQSEF